MPTVNRIGSLNQFCYQGWPSLICHAHPSGTTSGLCEAECYQDLPMSSMGGSPARISVLREMEWAWEEADRGYFSKSSDSFANFDRDSFSWRTSQLSLFGGLTEYSWNSLRWGTIVDGRLYQPQRWEPRTYESGGGSLPTLWTTPCADDTGHRREKYSQGGTALSTQVGGQPNPTWVEWLMGFPLGWTALEDWATQWFRPVREKRSNG